MECNKEEAIRAKGIAENKMQNKDFEAARKIAFKAQQLYKDLDNISQMLVVCDVHCCADKKLFGNEMDWYGILQIEQTSDEATIKKQYRKFALLLHPDKNKFPGAEAAFKLIGEAQRVLLDKGKRSLHDIKRRPPISKPAPSYRPQQRPTSGSNIGVQNSFRNNFTGVNLQQQQTQQRAGQQGFSNGRATFWTACPFCSVKYQYYVEVMKKSLICQNCAKPFVAYESVVHEAPTAANLNQSAFSQRQGVPRQAFSKVEVGGQGNLNSEHSKTEFPQKNDYNYDLGSQKAKSKGKRKREAESSDSCDTDSSIETEEDVPVDNDDEFKAGVNLGCHGERPRRSDRRKQHVSYKENHSDDDAQEFASQPKKAKRGGSSCATKEESRNGLKEDSFKTNNHFGVKDESTVKQKEDLVSSANGMEGTKNVKGKEKAYENGSRKSSEAHIDSASDSSSKSAVDPEFHDYPDPDFNDFDKVRNADCFSSGQIWAAYDTLDAMPRFYARIMKVFSPEFKLRITWLEPHPDRKDEMEWVNEGLPASCGKFINGSSENTEDRLMFSHMMNWEKGSQRGTYKIFPRKGEIWAVFKNWDLKWKSDADRSQKYEYEFVEVLSEYTEGVGASVVYLGKVKGFVSLFCRIRKEGKDSFQIPPGELFRFSHMIPSFKLTGEERESVPKGSFELDPASLPESIEEITVPKDDVVEDGNSHPNGSFSRSCSGKVKPEVESEASSGHQADGGADLEPEVVNVEEDCSVHPTSTMEAFEIPEPEFFNFDAIKSIGNFQAGQIWSLYSDEDGLPKYYGRIVKVASEQGFNIRLGWLTSCAMPKDVIQWNDKDMPVCCGKFKIKRGESLSYTSADCFSYQISAESDGKKNEYAILPRKGQIWALYRNWSPAIKVSDLENCRYDVVEVLEENDSWIKVSMLEQVGGFNSVFKVQFKGGSSVTMQVPHAELFKFSHHIPAFQLTDQRNGSLRGFWELDPAAVPVHYFDKK